MRMIVILGVKMYFLNDCVQNFKFSDKPLAIFDFLKLVLVASFVYLLVYFSFDNGLLLATLLKFKTSLLG